MSVKIRILQPKEYAHVTKLLDAEKRFAYLPDAFTTLWSVTPDGIPRALWAIERANELIGAAGYVVAETDRMLGCIGLIIAPAYRQQGIGGQVYTALLDALRRRGVAQMLTQVYAEQVTAAHFLVCRGFAASSTSIQCQLTVANVSLAAWDNPDEIVANQGLRFAALDRFPRAGLAERLLPLWNRTRPDQPQAWPFVPYTTQRLTREMLEPEEIALHHSFAIVTADNQIVALNLNIQDGQMCATQQLFTIYSAVDPAFRWRKLATALKLKLIAHAQAHEITFLAAENDERNQPMWQINQRLGYQRLADLISYHKTLDNQTTTTRPKGSRENSE